MELKRSRLVYFTREANENVFEAFTPRLHYLWEALESGI
jgi:hypothetical protein